MKILPVLLSTVCALTVCDKCLTLSDHNFDYLYLIEQDVCSGDLDCERSLRDLTLRFFAKYGGLSPCAEATLQDCANFSAKACSELIGDFCSRGAIDSRKLETLSDDTEFNRIISLRGSLKRLTAEVAEVQKNLNLEVSKEKQKYQGVLDRLSQLQSPV